MVKQTKSAWDDLPSQVQGWAKLGAGIAAFVAAVLGTVAISPNAAPIDSPRLDALERNDARQDTILSRMEPRSEYLFCVDLSDRQLIPQTPQDCFQTYATDR